MIARRKMSRRELWLVAMLPAALGVIVSWGLPGPKDRISTVENQLERLDDPADHERIHRQMHDLQSEMSASRQRLKQLQSKETAVVEQIAALKGPTRQASLSMAAELDALSRRLAAHEVQVLAMKPAEASAGRRSNRAGSSAPSSPDNAPWQVSLAATLTAVREALSQPDIFPDSLALVALQMDPPRPESTLRRWELVVAPQRVRP